MIGKLHFATLLGCVSVCAFAANPLVQTGEPFAPAPQYRVGDRWVYQAEDGFRVKRRWIETHEVTAIGDAGIKMRITQKGDGVDSVRNEDWASPGRVREGILCGGETRHFDAPLERLHFPLVPGDAWNQWVGVSTPGGAAAPHDKVNQYVRVSGWRRIATSAGAFDAVKLNVITQLDDADLWRRATVCNYTIWYAPSVRNVLREQREAEYVVRSDSDSVRTQHGALQLSAFTPGSGRSSLE